MDPVLVTIGDIEIRWYSALIALGLIIAYFGVIIESKRFNIDKNFIINVIFWAVIIGIIGARLYYVLFNLEYYGNHLNEIYQLWRGGLAIHGGLIFGILAIIIYCKKCKFSSLKMLDMAAPFVLIAQAIGRWGNFFNGEAYGVVTTYEKLKSLHIPKFIIDGMYINGHYNLPMFYFESIWCIVGAIFLLIIRRFKKMRKGQIAGLYMMWYSLGRFFIESYRTDSLLIGNIRVAQVVSIILFITGLVILIIQSRKKNEEDLYNTKEKNIVMRKE